MDKNNGFKPLLTSVKNHPIFLPSLLVNHEYIDSMETIGNIAKTYRFWVVGIIQGLGNVKSTNRNQNYWSRSFVPCRVLVLKGYNFHFNWDFDFIWVNNY